MGRGTVLVVLLGISGCAGVDRGTVAEHGRLPQAKPPAARYSTHDSFIIEDRFLVLPLATAGKTVFEKSSSCGSSGHVDLEVIDLQSGDHHRAFGRPVALERWGLSFQAHEQQGIGYVSPCSTDGKLRFPDMLILEARTEDANRDGKLTWEDPLALYGYDLARHELFPISPEKASVLKCQIVGDGLILTLGGAKDGVSIYRFTAATRQGRMIVENLVP